jgi:hypothetical protein
VIDLAGEGRSLWATGSGAVVKLSTSGRRLFRLRFRRSGWAIAVAPEASRVGQPFFWNRNRRIPPQPKPPGAC